MENEGGKQPSGDLDVRHTGSFGPPPDEELVRSLPTLDF